MRLSDLFATFDPDVGFFPTNHDAFDVGLGVDRWVTAPRDKTVATFRVSGQGRNAADAWSAMFAQLDHVEPTPIGVLLLASGWLEDVDLAALSDASSAAGLDCVAAVTILDTGITAAVLAMPTDSSKTDWPLDVSRLVLANAAGIPIEPGSDADVDGRTSSSAERVEGTEARRVADIEALRSELTRAELRTKAANEQFRSIRSSSAYRLGNLLGRSARNPLRAVVDLPRGLADIVRDRDSAATQAARAREALAAAEAPGSSGRGNFGLHSGIAGALQSRIRYRNGSAAYRAPVTIAHLSHPAFGDQRLSEWEVMLNPNDCLDAFERELPEALVIDSSAFVAGSPWAGAATGEDPRRATTVMELMFAAGRYGIPCVFRWHAPANRLPGVIRLAQACDVVVTSIQGSSDGLPALERSVALENWTVGPETSFHPLILDFQTLDPLDWGISTANDQFNIPETLARKVIGPPILLRPRSLRRFLGIAGLARFPGFAGHPLPVLESIASGLAVIGSKDHELPVVFPPDFDWSPEEMNAAQDTAAREITSTRWQLLQEHSTEEATRRIGGLTGNEVLASHGEIAAVVSCDKGISDSTASRLQEAATDFSSMLFVSDGEEDGNVERAASVTSHLTRSSTAAGWAEVASRARQLTVSSGRLWLTSLTELDESPVEAMRSAVTMTTNPHPRLFTGADISGMDDPDLAALFESLSAGTGQPGVTR